MISEGLPFFLGKLGVEMLQVANNGARARLIFRKEICDDLGVALGGVVMAVADALGCKLAAENAHMNSTVVPVDSNTNFLIEIEEGEIVNFSTKILYKMSDRIACETRTYREDGVLVAVTSATHILKSC